MPSIHELLTSGQPSLPTRQALIILGLQNDFLSPDGKLPIKTDRSYLDRIRQLVPVFRQHGNIIWVRSEFQSNRNVNEPTAGGCSVILGDTSDRNHQQPDTEEHDEEENPADNDAISRTVTEQPDLFRSQAEPTMVQPQAPTPLVDTQDLLVQENDADDELFLTEAPGREPCCISGTWGAKYAPEVLALEAPNDIHVTKTYYSAFSGTSLLNNLRMKLITEIYVAGNMTNLSVYASAWDAASHGLSINILEDCLGYRSRARHEEAIKQLVDQMGASITSSHTLISRLQGDDDASDDQHDGNDSTESRGSQKEDDKRDDSTERDTHRGSDQGSDRSSERGLEQSTDQNIHQATDQKHHSPSKSTLSVAAIDRFLSRKRRSVELTDTSTHELNEKLSNSQGETLRVKALPSRLARHKKRKHVHNLATFQTLGPGDVIGSGDTNVMYDLLPAPQSDIILQQLLTQVHWQNMYHAAGEVPRLVCCQGTVGLDGSMPVYRHPSDQSLPLMHWSPGVLRVKRAAEEKVGHELNHVLIQLYRGGTDYISEHSDKTLDIMPGSTIVNVSFGAQRTMRLRSKRASNKPDGDGDHVQANADPAQMADDGERFTPSNKASHHPCIDSESTATTPPTTPPTLERQTQRVHLPHNSIFTMGSITNTEFLHGIQPDKRLHSDLSASETAYSGLRISLTFRHIGTYLSHDSGLIWGLGATSPDRRTANPTVNGDGAASEALIRAFGTENQSSVFDRNAIYGAGSDVLHLKRRFPEVEREKEKAMVFLSSDEDENQSVRTWFCVCCKSEEVQFVSAPKSFWERDKETEFRGANGEVLDYPQESKGICFRDCDGRHTQIEGLVPVLLYLSRTRGRMARGKEGAGEEFGRDRIAKELELVTGSLLRDLQSASRDAGTSEDEVCGLLARVAEQLETRAMERRVEKASTDFMHGEERRVRTDVEDARVWLAGSDFGIVDCAFLPLVRRIFDAWKGIEFVGVERIERWLKAAQDAERVAVAEQSQTSIDGGQA